MFICFEKYTLRLIKWLVYIILFDLKKFSINIVIHTLRLTKKYILISSITNLLRFNLDKNSTYSL
jgi:hypothetical protein